MALTSSEKYLLEKQLRRLNSKVCLLKEEDQDIQAELDLKADLVGGVVPTDQLPINQDTIDALNNANAPTGTNYFTTLADLSSITPGTLINVVANYSALPAANTVSGEFYWVENSQGTSWLPGPLGGTYYSNGLYYSNGTTWIYTDMPYNATQIEVDGGLNNNKFVTPLTFTNASKWGTKQNNITLTTTGTSGAATFAANTLNIPQYQGVLTNPVTGTGTSGQVVYWSGTSTQTGSNNLFWDSANSRLGVNISNPLFSLDINGLSRFNNTTFISPVSDINSYTPYSTLNIVNNGPASFTIDRFSTNSTAPHMNLRKSRGTTTASSSIQTNDELGFIGFWGHDGTSFQRNAIILASALSVSGGVITPILRFGLGTNSGTNTYKLRIENSGNIATGDFVPSARLHVVGSGTTSSTTALLVQNATPSDLFSITDNGQVNYTPIALLGSVATSAIDIQQIWNTTGTPSLIKANVTDTASNANSKLMDLRVGNDVRFQVNKGTVGGFAYFNSLLVGVGVDGNVNELILRSAQSSTTTGNDFTFASAQGPRTNTSGTVNVVVIRSGIFQAIAPTSGTAVFNILNIPPTINQTGGANGITRGLYVNPTLTSAADWRSIEWSNNTGWGLYGAGSAANYLAGVLTIGTTSPNASAKVQIDSTTQGVLFPRMTTTQRDAIATPAAGLVIFNTTTTKLECYDGAAWQAAW